MKKRTWVGTVKFDSPEDSGQALPHDTDFVPIEPVVDEDNGVFITLASWDDNGKHDEAKELEGKRVEVTLRVVEDQPAVPSDRGFNRFPAIPGSYGDGDSYGGVQVYESSAASGPHLWLKVTEPGIAREDQKDTTATLHLSLENALTLRDQIEWLIANHYQVR
ncbi:MAG: hypothetical protein JSS66_06025 [Armatimonadetes bacterium]|nr:hypothetical protein [Armatimonadota bacterium]